MCAIEHGAVRWSLLGCTHGRMCPRTQLCCRSASRKASHTRAAAAARSHTRTRAHMHPPTHSRTHALQINTWQDYPYKSGGGKSPGVCHAGTHALYETHLCHDVHACHGAYSSGPRRARAPAMDGCETPTGPRRAAAPSSLKRRPGFHSTGREYAERSRATAGGGAALTIRRGGTLAPAHGTDRGGLLPLQTMRRRCTSASLATPT